MPPLDSKCDNRFDQMYAQFLDALFEKDRLSYLGKLVRGLIHNINGPLQNISMLVEVLTRGLDQMDRLVRSPGEDFLQKWDSHYQKQKQRFERLSEQVFIEAEILRDFMVLQEIERTDSDVDLKLVLSKLASVFHADLFLKHHVHLELQLGEQIPLVRVPGRVLVPALVHMLRNSIRAVRETERKRIVIQCRREDGEILVVFSDSGCGFDDDQDVDELFALFCTKWPNSSSKDVDPEKHIGFGLFAARGLLAPYGVRVILERHGDETSSVIKIPIPRSMDTQDG